MPNSKVVFVAFAIEDERQRDFLKGQSLSPRAPYEFIDMSVKEPYDKDWKDRVRTRIRRSDGVIALNQQELTELERAEVGNPVRKGGEEATPWNLGLLGRPNEGRWRHHLSVERQEHQ